MNLALCSSCSRHARGSVCPFCGSALPEPVEPQRVSRRDFTRTAVALGAAVVAATGCSNAEEEETVVIGDETSGGEREEERREVFNRDCDGEPGACTMPYGAPPDRPEWV